MVTTPIPIQIMPRGAVRPAQLPLAVTIDAAQARLARIVSLTLTLAEQIDELRDQLQEVRSHLTAGRHEDLLRAGEVAALIKLPESIVKELAEAGEIPAVDVRGCLRFPALGVEDWLARRTETRGEL